MVSRVYMMFAVVALFAASIHAFPGYEQPEQEEEHMGYVINADGAVADEKMDEMDMRADEGEAEEEDAALEELRAQLCEQFEEQLHVVKQGKASIFFLFNFSPVLEVTRGRFYDSLTLTSFLLNQKPDLKPVRKLFKIVALTFIEEVDAKCGIEAPEEIVDKILGVTDMVEALGLAGEVEDEVKEEEEGEEEGKGEDDMEKFPINLRTVGGKKRQEKPDRFVIKNKQERRDMMKKKMMARKEEEEAEEEGAKRGRKQEDREDSMQKMYW